MVLVASPAPKSHVSYELWLDKVSPFLPQRLVASFESRCAPASSPKEPLLVRFSHIEVLTFRRKEEFSEITEEGGSLIEIVERVERVCNFGLDQEGLPTMKFGSSVVQPHKLAKQFLGERFCMGEHGYYYEEELIYGDSLNQVLHLFKEKFEAEHLMRLKAGIFYSLYNEDSFRGLSLSESDHESCRKMMREFFPKLARDLQEDIKHSIWYQLGSPDTLGSDFGLERFMANPSDRVCSQAVHQAIFRPRYHPASSSEPLELQIESISHFIESLQFSDSCKEAHSEKRKLYVFQVFELAACGVSESFKERILHAFNSSFDFYERKDIYTKVNKLIGDPSANRIFFERNPFSCPSMSVMRLEKQLMLNRHFHH